MKLLFFPSDCRKRVMQIENHGPVQADLRLFSLWEPEGRT